MHVSSILRHMKTTVFALLPILFAGLLLPDKSCGPKEKAMNNLEQIDGPYVLYRDNQVFVKSIVSTNGIRQPQSDSFQISERSNIKLQVNTDIPGKVFTVRLKPELKNEVSETSQAEKILVISDIEGNFGAFRKLLQGNGVIDSSLNWIYGNGHLVLTGDFCDRGFMVTEVYWLIYMLEEQAKTAGGYVHYILGNHEIMNMSGDVRYLHGKYLETENLLKVRYEQLHNEHSELGRWLRTKNVVEKVGDILFAHGGISQQVNEMDVTVNSINDLVRPYYADTTYRYPDKKVDTLFSDAGPFWYRGYYRGTLATSESIDNTLAKFGVHHIATGHTIMADTVSNWFNGRVFNTDVHHAEGKSEALLIEKGKFYRVNAAGKRTWLSDK
jgi:hypothetical protein